MTNVIPTRVDGRSLVTDSLNALQSDDTFKLALDAMNPRSPAEHAAVRELRREFRRLSGWMDEAIEEQRRQAERIDDLDTRLATRIAELEAKVK